jgi:5-methylcytosine-specific restriction endonuclease McrA
MDAIVTKKCAKCGEEKELSFFYASRRGLYGRRSACKSCENQDHLVYYHSHKAKYKLLFRSYRERNVQAVRTREKRYSDEHKEDRASQRKAYRKSHPEKERAWRRKKDAARRGNGGEFNEADWVVLLNEYGGKCLSCGDIDDLTLDHVIPLSGGGKHEYSNAQPLCRSCNSKKGTKTIDYRKGAHV